MSRSESDDNNFIIGTICHLFHKYKDDLNPSTSFYQIVKDLSIHNFKEIYKTHYEAIRNFVEDDYQNDIKFCRFISSLLLDPLDISLIEKICEDTLAIDSYFYGHDV